MLLFEMSHPFPLSFETIITTSRVLRNYDLVN